MNLEGVSVTDAPGNKTIGHQEALIWRKRRLVAIRPCHHERIEAIGGDFTGPDPKFWQVFPISP
jgi:hypothetical protein